MASQSYDFIVVGGGTAGCVLAARLSENPDHQVLVMEAGEDHNKDPRVLTPAMWHTLIRTPVDWAYDTIPQEGLGGRKDPFPHGRLLGGTSAINGMTFSPVPKSNVDAWAALGNPGWEWANFSQSFKKVYTLSGKDGSGSLELSYPELNQEVNPWPSFWKDTLAAAGYSVAGDLFTGQGNGMIINPEAISPKTRQRNSAFMAYLAPVLHRNNLTVLTGIEVEKVVFRPNSGPSQDAVAEGVQYTNNGETRIIGARKEVILASGAINSPMLLERSGVGSAQLLTELGIDVVVDNPNVGENLQNHIILMVCNEAQAGIPTLDGIAQQDPTAVAEAIKAYSENQSGPLATAGVSHTGQLPFPNLHTSDGKQELEHLLSATLGAKPTYSKSPEAFHQAHQAHVHSMLSSPDEASGIYITFPGLIKYDPTGIKPLPPTDAANSSTPPDPTTYFSLGLLTTHPLSRGSTHITASPDHNYGTSINPGYLTHPLDIEIFARSLRNMDVLLSTPPLSTKLNLVNGKRYPPGPPVGGFQDLEVAKEYIGKYATGGNHFVGSCSMMPREMGGVVDHKLRVYGTKGLRVCDASVIPLIPRANPQAGVYGVAEHGVGIILGDYV